MQVVHANAHLQQVVRQLLRHALGQRGHQDALALIHTFPHLLKEVINLAPRLLHLNGGVQEAGRSDDLLNRQRAKLMLVWARRGRDEDHLVGALRELVEVQRSVVDCRWEPESELHQGGLPCEVTMVHAPELRDAHVGLVYEQQVVIREVVQQCPGCAASLSSADVAGVVLNAGAIAYLLQHLHIVTGALLKPGRFQHLVLGTKPLHMLTQLCIDAFHGCFDFLIAGDEVLGRVYLDLVPVCQNLSGKGVDLQYLLDLIAEEGHTDG